MSEETLCQELYDSFKNRAILYYLIFDEMRTELGAERAEEILARAIHRRGTQNGKNLAPFAPADFEGLKKAFLGGIPDGGHMFDPRVLRCDDQGLDIQFRRCPLKEAWQEMGLTDDELATICRIAARVDQGLFKSAGFAFSAETWQPGGDGCCYLHVRPGK